MNLPPELRIDIEDADGIHHFDPNSLVLAVVDGQQRHWRPIPDLASELSRQDAVWYRSHDVTLCLTLEELERLVMLRLTRDEYMTLQSRHGIVFEWHEDFYDPDSGEALQPKN